MRSLLARSVSAVGIGLLLTACGQATTPQSGGISQPPPQQAASQSEAVKRGGILHLSAGSDSYGGTDPAMGQQSYNVWPIIGEYFLRAEPETWKLAPAAIEKWEYSADGLALTLHVRKGVKFHNRPPINGREMEAKDITYTLKSITGQLYPQLPTVRFPRRSQYEQMTDAVAVDKYTVKVTLSEQSATFLEGLSEYRAGVVLPDGLREAFGDLESLAKPAIDRYIAARPSH